jgi:hypothetical protein
VEPPSDSATALKLRTSISAGVRQPYAGVLCDVGGDFAAKRLQNAAHSLPLSKGRKPWVRNKSDPSCGAAKETQNTGGRADFLRTSHN